MASSNKHGRHSTNDPALRRSTDATAVYQPAAAWVCDDTDVDEAAPLLGPASRHGVSARGVRQTYATFLLLGFLSLMPWCMFTNAFEYFRVRFAGSMFADNFASYLSFGYTGTSMLTMLLATSYQHRARKTRDIILAAIVIAAMFVVVAAMTQMESLAPEHCFYVVLAASTLSSAASAVLQVYSFAILAWFPPINIQATLNGQGVAGLLSSVLQLISALNGVEGPTPTGESDAGTRTLVVFALAATSGAAVAVNFAQFINSAPYRDGMAEREVSARRAAIRDEPPPHAKHTAAALLRGDDAIPSAADASPTPAQVIAKIWRPALTSWLIFTVTISLFPSITSKIIPPGSVTPYQRELFVAVHFLLFNFCDWLGRMIPVFVYAAPLRNNALLLGAALLRIAFIPAILLCNIQDPNRWYTPLLPNSLLFLGILMLLALTNGWYTSMAFLNAPLLVTGMERPLASTFMAVALSTGLASGSAFSFAMQGIVCGCNPFIGGT
ncbi:nucleoside transporter-domain-containing protein [Syncephalis pseudoplumigaleata]|uniref:Nucleoside transporter-domain-containing protein n=1 Tax=Syncephalis pseudoplumigaleata TaxID=1712513 RepID=A0A4P9Z098_9FUNG|nr:nucleoside transporter-domain-containing protein [Syncephalis pseudoplumigaleata]|eukprot:RKP25804.1 nucleoside transporter-domain-containing protein [Syncephalis pseudoplumigaleata]